MLKLVEKFHDPIQTADGAARAFVDLQKLKTLWFNTGAQCNLSCENCYIESSPQNDRLSFLTVADVQAYLDEIEQHAYGTSLIGFTGGEPFLNPHFLPILQQVLSRGFEVLVLSNGFRRIEKYKEALLQLKESYGNKLQLRISLDHHTAEIHEQERGLRTFVPTMKSAVWLSRNGFRLSIAGRAIASETSKVAIRGFQKLFDGYGLQLDANSPEHLVIFPEMDLARDVPEITTECWDILKVKPEQQMCASERMIIKRKGASAPSVMPCTLLAYDTQFDLGQTLERAQRRVQLNHKFCAQFCVLGGASCSSTA